MQPNIATLPPISVGVNVSAEDLTGALDTFPRMRFCRVFGPPGAGIPSWRSPVVSQLLAAGVTPWFSFKDWTSDAAALAAFNTWLDACPAGVSEAYLTYRHEPMGDADIDADTFRDRWVRLAGACDAHRYGHKIRLVPIFHLYPVRHKCSDRYSRTSAEWVGDWVRWWPTMRDGGPAGDMMGWDCYQELSATRYEDPASFLRVPVGAAYAAGVPLVIPELGAVRVAGDATGEGRAAWISGCVAHLRAEAAVGVAWWHGQGASNADYRLGDAPSIAAWRRATGEV
jgi:hypothetical protein